jgi:type VI secretion system ImpC/EvpB family protein
MDKPPIGEEDSGPLAPVLSSGAAVAVRPGPGLKPPTLESLLDSAALASQSVGTDLDEFLSEPAPWKALAIWLGRGGRLRGPFSRGRVARMLLRDIAQIDAQLSRQLNAILHHPSFQKLEASWRGLKYLVDQMSDGAQMKVRVLNVTWKELYRDQERAIEFDQSQLFRKVYNEEFGHPGGEPYSVLLGDYEIRHKPAPDHPTEDIGALVSISQVAAAAFAPFIVAAHPAMLDLESFTALEKPLNLPKTFEQLEYLKWRSFRHMEDTRFIGLTLPRVLMRKPYRDTSSRVDGFRFHEDVEDPSRKEYLWGTAVYAFGAVLLRAFAQSGWLAAIRGIPADGEGGGVVAGLPSPSFTTDRPGLVPRSVTEVIITDAQEKELSELGFIPLSQCQDSDRAVFFSNASVQKPKVYDELPATINARLSGMLQYMLCVARFAHYIKVIARDKVGSFTNPGDLQEFLQDWLSKYATSSEKAGEELKSQYPLREGRVDIRERPDKPGTYACAVHLRPHFQLDQLVTAVKLMTQLAPPTQ